MSTPRKPTPANLATRRGKYCKSCGGSGKVDRGNGTTKPCDCVAGLIENFRRRQRREARR
jgi:hypothetical protein